MEKRFFGSIFLIFLFSCLWVNITFGQSFYNKPIATLGKGAVREVAYSADGKILAAAVSDGIYLYDTEELNEICLLHHDNLGELRCIAFSPDGMTLASAGTFSKSIWLWDLRTLQLKAILKGHDGNIWSLAFSPDGKILASGSADKTIRLWDPVDQEQVGVLVGHTDEVYPVDFSPDGQLLASGGKDNTIRLWDVNEQKQAEILYDGEGWIHSLAFSPDGRWLASGSGHGDTSIRLWDISSGEQASVLEKYSGIVFSMDFSPDSKQLVYCGSGRDIWLWNLDSRKEMTMPRKHQSMIYSVAFSPDGKTIASGSPDKTLRLWDLETLQQTDLIQYGHIFPSFGYYYDRLAYLNFTANGKILVSTGTGYPWLDNNVILWNTEEQRLIKSIETDTSHGIEGHCIALSGDKTTLAILERSRSIISVWDVQGDMPEQIAEIRDEGILSNNNLTLAISSDGSIIAVADRLVRLWDVHDQNQIGELEIGNEIVSMAFSPDLSIVAVALNGDSSIQLWDIYRHEQIGELEIGDRLELGNDFLSLSFSPGGKSVILCSGNWRGSTIRIWSLDTGKRICILEGSGWFGTYTFSPDGSLFAYVGIDETIRLWDMQRLQEVVRLEHMETGYYGVASLAFSPDGKTLASGSMRTVVAIAPARSAARNSYNPETVRIWDIGTQKQLNTLEGWGTVAFSPDGKLLATSGRLSTILIWGQEEPLLALDPRGKMITNMGKIKSSTLMQNFPNPFNPDTWIPYSLAEDSSFIIKIYNVRGQLVRKLALGEKAAGVYATKDMAVHWDGCNESGEPVASGIYFYQMVTPDFQCMKRMTIMR